MNAPTNPPDDGEPFDDFRDIDDDRLPDEPDRDELDYDERAADGALDDDRDLDRLGDHPTEELDRDDLGLDRDRLADDDTGPVPAGSATAAGRPGRSGPLGRMRAALVANPVRVVLAAVIIGALVAGVVALSAGLFRDRGSVGPSTIGENERIAQNAFTESKAGDCLTWPAGQPGNPKKVVCTEKHRFEVSGAIDTSLLPGSEFGSSAPWPGPERFATIRDEQCPVVVNSYLNGRLDPQGRFSVGLMNPSEVQWGRGARSLRCGIQQTGPDGQPDEFAGAVADVDQALTWEPGTCIGIDPATRKPTTPVNCSERHAFQTTGVIDLSTRFGGKASGKPWPATNDQNDLLRTVCPPQAERFAGGKNKLDATTLNVQWSVLSEPSWLAGSRTAVCYLGLPDRGGFATLVGDVRSTVLINGKLPVPPPAAPPGRALPTPVPLPPGVQPNPLETPAPSGGG